MSIVDNLELVCLLLIRDLPTSDSCNVYLGDWHVICTSEFIIIFYIKKGVL